MHVSDGNKRIATNRSHSHPGIKWDSFNVSPNDKFGAKDVREFNSDAKFNVYMPELTKDNYNKLAKEHIYQASDGNYYSVPLMKVEPPKSVDY